MAKKTGMADFQKSRRLQSSSPKSSSEEQAVAPEGINQAARRENEGASPMLGSPRAAGLIKKTERKTIRLPISGSEIELTATTAVPAECRIHPQNQRVQALLKLSNPKVAQLKDSVKNEEQRDPVLARWITISGGKRAIEILDGSRRRFVCDALHKEDGETLLKAWVGQIPDADADYLAKAGNNNRDDISPWELAQYLKHVERENPTWSHHVIAANEGMSRASVSSLLAIANIPVDVVGLLESPDLLKVQPGLQLIKLLNTAEENEKEKDVKAAIAELESEAPFSKFSHLVKRLQEILNPDTKPEKPSSNRKVEIMSGDKVRAAIGANRRVKGQFKIDLFNLSEGEYEKIFEFLEKTLK